MVQNPNKDARKLRLFQLPFPRINEGISISYTATHNKLPAAKQIKAAAPAPSKLAARKVPSPMPNGVIKERRINNVHQALTDTVSSSKDPAEKAANSLCAMIAINISENSDISSAAPEAVPSMRECRHRPRTPTYLLCRTSLVGRLEAAHPHLTHSLNRSPPPSHEIHEIHGRGHVLCLAKRLPLREW